MQIEQHKHGAVTVLRPRGPIASKEDAESVRAAGLEALGRTLGRFVVDASDIPFVDSNGLEALVDVTGELGAGGRNLCLCGVGETLREILLVTDVAPMFSMHEDVQSAVRGFL